MTREREREREREKEHKPPNKEPYDNLGLPSKRRIDLVPSKREGGRYHPRSLVARRINPNRTAHKLNL